MAVITKLWERQAHFEGTHTSYSWQERNEVIIKETPSFYIIDNGRWGTRKIKKTNVRFTKPENPFAE